MRKKIVKILSILFPNLVVSYAYNQLTNPQIKKLRPNEQVVLDKALKEKFQYQGFDIQLYTWKGGSDSILLVHGWEGQAGNFADLIEKFVENNYTVYAFDGPSHGFSSKGKTSILQFVDLVGILIKKYGATKLMSHSFGGVAATYALSLNPELKIDKYILLTVPDKFLERIDDVAKQVGITEKVKNKLIARLDIETGNNVKNLNVSEFVKNINVNKALIIHDTNDKVLPINRSKNVHQNWKNSEFLEISNTGHFRILRTDYVIEKSLEFFKDGL